MALDRSTTLGIAKKASTVLLGLAHVGLRVGLVALRVGVRVGAVVGAVGLAFLTDDERRRRVRGWLLLSGSRWYIVGALTGGMFLVTFSLGLMSVIGVRESGFVTTMFSTIIAGLFSFVPIVVAVNQLTITRLFGTPETLRDRVDEIEAFRADVERLNGDVTVSPTDPSAFLTVVLDGIAACVDDIRDATRDAPPAVHEDVTDLLSTVEADAGHLRAELGHPNTTLFDVLKPMLDDEYSRVLNETRRVAIAHDDALSDAATDRLADLQELLVAVDVSRQYFKVLYLQQELAAVSRWLAYSGIGSFVASTLIIMLYASGYPPIVDATTLLFLVSVGLAASFLPFAILFAYVLRIATIVQRTSAPGAFTPPRERPLAERP